MTFTGPKYPAIQTDDNINVSSTKYNQYMVND
jgi:hypothetical protein